MKTSTINFRISEEQKENLQILADNDGVKLSFLARQVVTNYINNLVHYEDEEDVDTKKTPDIILDSFDTDHHYKSSL
jgi:predicted DNA-binding protein